MFYNEIKDRFRNEFVLLANPKYGDGINPEQGDVLYHNSDRTKVWDEAKRIASNYPHFTVLYTGEVKEELDDDFAFIL